MHDVCNVVISIHAPTRGATTLLNHVSYFSSISIHAPTRGATDGGYSKPKDTSISIHAPTRGATLLPWICGRSKKDFNPRSHERSDSNIAQKICLFLYNTDNKYIIR